jgi:soluble lytic murein transglycosylase
VLAAAAYNAGPQRVRQWLGRHCLEADRWIEAIPFSETRSYVRRALFYIAVYERRLGVTVGRLAASMPAVPARGAAPTTECEP